MIVIPKTAQRLWLTCVLDYVKGATAGGGELLVLHLYKNDFAPDQDTVLADFVEASFPGYAVRFIGADFPFPVTNADGNAESKSHNYIWTPANQQDNQEVHGWYLTFSSNVVPALLFAAERIAPAFKANAAGQELKLEIALTLGGCFA
jgi:hypothetical protein